MDVKPKIQGLDYLLICEGWETSQFMDNWFMSQQGILFFRAGQP